MATLYGLPRLKTYTTSWGITLPACESRHMADDFPIDPDEPHPFTAYRRSGASGLDFELAISLTHFYESEKFRWPGLEEIRLQVLSAPNARRARSIAHRHLDSWRPDWKLVRGRVFRAALSMQATQSSQARARLKDVAEEALRWSSCTARKGTLPVAWMTQQVLTLGQGRMDGATPRVGLLTLQRYTPKDIGNRLSALFAGEPPHGAATFIGEGSDSAAEAWCVQQAVPLRFIGDPARRLRSAECVELLKRVNALVICAPSTRKDVRELVALARKTKIPVHALTVVEAGGDQA
ncbi:MAG TPA: hypothetical protein VNM48_07260, partial [Chloroflexota bacterium]|nr:hypothetical protein [Chloroflexota bacterium]